MLASLSDLKWMNHPLAISQAAYKPEQLARAGDHDLLIPETLITSEPSEAEKFCREYGWQVVAKPIGHGEVRDGNGQTQYCAYTNMVSPDCLASLSLVANCPTLFQQYIRRPMRHQATVVGDQCIGVALPSQENTESKIDCRREKTCETCATLKSRCRGF